MLLIALVLVSVLLLYIWSSVSSAGRGRRVQKRVRQLTSQCHSVPESLFVVLNCSETDIPLAVANCFAAAVCPQKVFITSPLQESTMIRIEERIKSALESLGQPTLLSNNFTSTVVYTREDMVRQCVEENFASQDLILVSQGNGVFVDGFDSKVRDSVRRVRYPEKCLFTQFAPFHKLASPGYPTLSRRAGRPVLRCEPFRRSVASLIPILAANPQLLWFAAQALPQVELAPMPVSRSLQSFDKFMPYIYTVTSAVMAFPNNVNWWKSGLAMASQEKPFPWRYQYGLSENASQEEIISKLGSLRRYESIKFTATKKLPWKAANSGSTSALPSSS